MAKRYLIVKTSSLGDVVHCLPVVSYLKQLDPACSVDWIVEKGAAGLLQACTQIDRVIVVDTKRWRKSLFSKDAWHEFWEVRRQLQHVRYDVVFDLQGNSKSALWTFLSNADVKGGFGKKSVPEFLNRLVTNRKIELSETSHLNIVQDYLWMTSHVLGMPMPEKELPPISLTVGAKDAALVETLRGNGKKAILIAPGSAWENKRLSKAQLVILLEGQSREDSIFLAWGSDAELELCRSLAELHSNITVIPKLSLEALQCFMSKMDLVISMDSLSLHLAATTGVPTLSFFGPSNGAKFAPKGQQHRYIQGSCPYGETFPKRCRKLRSCPTGACIKNL